MLQYKKILIAVMIVFVSCKKSDTQISPLAGKWNWTIQYANNPAYNTTPQSTGIIEIFTFNVNSTYSLTQNNAVINTGTYKMSTATSTNGASVASILFTNSRVTDSVSYYSLNADSLYFCYDLIGTVGSGSRHYSREK
jgi:hypothetical protein